MASPVAPAPAAAPSAAPQAPSGPGPLPSFAEIVGPAAGGQPVADQQGLDFLPPSAPPAPGADQEPSGDPGQAAAPGSALEALLASLPEDQRAGALQELRGLKSQAGRVRAAQQREAELQAQAQAADALARAVQVASQGVPLAAALQAAGIDPAALGVAPQAPGSGPAPAEQAPPQAAPKGFVGHLYEYLNAVGGESGWGTAYINAMDSAALLTSQADEALASAAVADDPRQRVQFEQRAAGFRQQARAAQIEALKQHQMMQYQPIFRAFRELEQQLEQRYGPIEQAWQRAQQADAANAQARNEWRGLASEMALLRDDEGNLAFGPESAFPIFGVDADGNATEPTEEGIRALQQIDGVLKENGWRRDRGGFQRAITYLIGQMALSGNLPLSDDEQQGGGAQAAPGGGMTTLPGPGLAPGAPMRPSVSRPAFGPSQDYDRMFDQRGQQR